jgi:hypothetical protein
VGEKVAGIVETYGRAFPDMHRELYDFFVSEDTVVVELSLTARRPDF